MGFQRLFQQEQRRRFFDRAFPAGAKVHLGLSWHVHQLAPCAGREVRWAHPPRPDWLPARPQDAGAVECARAGAHRLRPHGRAGQPTLGGHGPHGPPHGRCQGQSGCRRRPHGAPARAWWQLRHQGFVARRQGVLPGVCGRRRPVGGRPALQPGRRRDHLLRRHRDGRLGAHEGHAHQGRHGQVRDQEPHLQAQPHHAHLQRLPDL